MRHWMRVGLIAVALGGGCKGKPATPAAQKPAAAAEKPAPASGAKVAADAPNGGTLSGSLRQDASYLVVFYYLQKPGDAPQKALAKHNVKARFAVTNDALDPHPKKRTLRFGTIADTPAPEADELEDDGRGLSDKERAALAHPLASRTLQLVYPAADALAAARDADQLIYGIANDSHGYIYDSATQETFTPEAWRTERLSAWAGSEPKIPDLVSVSGYRDGDAHHGVISAGMSKLGLPDVALEGLDDNDRDMAFAIMASTLQALGTQGGVSAKGELELQGPSSKLRVRLEPGPQKEGEERVVRVHVPHELLTSEAPIEAVRGDNAALAVAIDAVRAKLPALHARYLAGLPANHVLVLKVRFRAASATEDAESESMWVRLRSWKDDVVMGELLDRPQFVPDLHQGDGIRAPDAEVQDYAIMGPSGEPVEGPFLDAIVAKSAYMKRAQTR